MPPSRSERHKSWPRLNQHYKTWEHKKIREATRSCQPWTRQNPCEQSYLIPTIILINKLILSSVKAPYWLSINMRTDSVPFINNSVRGPVPSHFFSKPKFLKLEPLYYNRYIIWILLSHPPVNYVSLRNAVLVYSISLRKEYPSFSASFKTWSLAMILIELYLHYNLGARTVQHNLITVWLAPNITLILLRDFCY